MKNQLEPWEVGLADKVQAHEFDFDASAFEGFEKMFAAEGAASAGAGAVDGSGAGSGTWAGSGAGSAAGATVTTVTGGLTLKTLLIVVLSATLTAAGVVYLLDGLGESTAPTPVEIPAGPTTEPTQEIASPAIGLEPAAEPANPSKEVSSLVTTDAGLAEETDMGNGTEVGEPSPFNPGFAPAAAPDLPAGSSSVNTTRRGRVAVAKLPLSAGKYTPTVRSLYPPEIEIPPLQPFEIVPAVERKRDRSKLFPDVIEH